MQGLRVNQGSESRYRERDIGLELDQISCGKGTVTWDSLDIGPNTLDKGSDIQSRTPDTPSLCPDTPDLHSDVRSGVLDTPRFRHGESEHFAYCDGLSDLILACT